MGEIGDYAPLGDKKCEPYHSISIMQYLFPIHHLCFYFIMMPIVDLQQQNIIISFTG